MKTPPLQEKQLKIDLKATWKIIAGFLRNIDE